jgi:hypothetical protein
MVPADIRLRFIDLTSRLVDGAVSDEGLDSNEEKLLRRYPSLPAWPFDARLSISLMAWLIGPGFHIPAFKRAVADGIVPDFRAAASACEIAPKGHPGVVALNGWTGRLFRNAQRVVELNMDSARVYFPVDLCTLTGR